MKNDMVCSNCGFIGKSKTKTKGSFLIELFLWMLLIFPGILYSLWRLISREKVCPKCETPNMIPSNTPRGEELIKKYEVKKS